MEPEGALPCLQGPSSGPFPESDESSPYHPILYDHYLSTFAADSRQVVVLHLGDLAGSNYSSL
jgi:hypothetical protein